MGARVQVRAIIWADEGVVVHRVTRLGHEHVTLPGGRVNARESVVSALEREVREELGIEVVVGDLLYAGEVLSGARRQDVELVFEARPRRPADLDGLPVVDPSQPGCQVLPPVLPALMASRQAGGDHPRWLGNLFSPNLVT